MEDRHRAAGGTAGLGRRSASGGGEPVEYQVRAAGTETDHDVPGPHHARQRAGRVVVAAAGHHPASKDERVLVPEIILKICLSDNSARRSASSVGVMQPVPGVLLGEDLGQPLLELRAYLRVFGEGLERVLEFAPVVLQLVGRQCVRGMGWLLDGHLNFLRGIEEQNLAT